MNPVIYIFVNKSLNMSSGKVAAQAAHAAAMTVCEEDQEKRLQWLTAPHKTILVMEARNELHIMNIEKYLKDRGIKPVTIVDEGVNEIDAHTITALATNILSRDDEYTQQTMSTFRLFKEKIRITMEIDK